MSLGMSYPLQGGSIVAREAALQSAILNALIPIQGPPLTFCAASNSKLRDLRPWHKAFTLQEIGQAKNRDFDQDGYITSEELMAIVLQLVWTLAALQNLFPGYQHNSLSTSVRLYQYDGARCYKIRDQDAGGRHIANDTSFYVRKFLPLPVIVYWNTSDCLVKNIDIPFRTEQSSPAKDMIDLLTTMIGLINVTLPPFEYRSLDTMKSQCTMYSMKIRRAVAKPSDLLIQDNEEIYFDKTETGENVCVPQLLALECPDGFTPLNGPRGEMTLCGKCARRAVGRDGYEAPGEVAPEIIPSPAGAAFPWMCSTGVQLEKTTRLVSKFFDDFLDPIEIGRNGYAVVDGF
jgi:hypothetical protein